MIKILYLITDLNIGGTEKILYEITRRIDKNKYVPVVVGFKKFGFYAQKIKYNNIKVKTLNLYENVFYIPFKILVIFFYFIRLIKKEKINLIHSFLFQANITGKILGFIMNIPVITSIRVVEQQKKWHLFVEKVTKKLTKIILVNSITLKNFIKDKLCLTDSKLCTIYNGIDINECLISPDKRKYISEFKLNENDIIISTVARIHKQKGIKYLIEGAKLLELSDFKDKHKIKFLIVGDGPERKTLELMIKKFGLIQKVKFLGWRKDSLEIISISDIFVLTSLWEGTPNVILEAMVLSKPIISTNVGGIPELIEDGKSGLLILPAAPKMLYEKIIYLIENPLIRQNLALNAYHRVKTFFTLEKMIADIQQLYSNVLKI